MQQMESNMYVRTGFTPLRMISGQKEPVTLQVSITNRSESSRGYSVNVKAPSKFSFDRTGLMADKRVRIGFIPSKETKTASFNLYGKIGLPKGLYDMDVIIREHRTRFDQVDAQKKVTATLRVED